MFENQLFMLSLERFNENPGFKRSMIHRNSQTLQIPAWQNELNRAIKDPKTLFEYLDLPKEYLPKAIQAHHAFPLRAPISFVSRIKKGDINDPLLRQILPLDLELVDQPGYNADPVGDSQAEKLPGLIHKYPNRVLLTLTGACAIHCRYCFRRHFDYQASNPSRRHWSKILEYIKSDTGISEVILSGGDPLSLSDKRLQSLIADLEEISHVKFLRFHTRQPVVIPARITDEFIRLLSETRFKPILVLHINHPQEIDTELKTAIAKLKEANIDLLNQTVLLKGVNDSVSNLTNLSLALGQAGVFPYYLHMLDKVTGASHFNIEQAQALKIMEKLKQSLPGYLVPKLVQEVQGAPYKLDVR